MEAFPDRALRVGIRVAVPARTVVTGGWYVGHTPALDQLHHEARAANGPRALVGREHRGHGRAEPGERADDPGLAAGVEIEHDARLARRLQHHRAHLAVDGDIEARRTVGVATEDRADDHVRHRKFERIGEPVPERLRIQHVRTVHHGRSVRHLDVFVPVDFHP